MLTTALISFREFLEAFLIVGIFLGISKKLGLKKEKEICLAALIGYSISLSLATITYFFGDMARGALTKANAELLESYLLVFSGFFITYVIFSLHDMVKRGHNGKLIQAREALTQKSFDISLFFTIVSLISREGFEVALFTASTSLFSVFLTNFLGLIVGFLTASIIGIASYTAFIKFPIKKVFKISEYLIILLGASLVQNGVTELLNHQYHIRLSDIARLPVSFLPSERTLVGHVIQTLTGIDNEFSIGRLSVMALYIGIVYLLFLKKKMAKTIPSHHAIPVKRHPE